MPSFDIVSEITLHEVRMRKTKPSKLLLNRISN